MNFFGSYNADSNKRTHPLASLLHLISWLINTTSTAIIRYNKIQSVTLDHLRAFFKKEENTLPQFKPLYHNIILLGSICERVVKATKREQLLFESM